MGDLTDNKPFETEVRFRIDDIAEFHKTVAKLNVKLIKEYAFTDHYFKPLVGEWNSLEKTLRIRDWRKPDLPTAIYLTKDEVRHEGGFSFKRSVYPEGKKTIFTGTFNECQQILHDLGFHEVYFIEKKQGFVWQDTVQELEFCAEETDVLGWTGEMEIDGSDLEYVKQRIAWHQEVLHLSDEQLSFKPLAVMIEDRLARK